MTTPQFPPLPPHAFGELVPDGIYDNHGQLEAWKDNQRIGFSDKDLPNILAWIKLMKEQIGEKK